MRGSRVAFIAVALLVLIAIELQSVSAQYWFQTGASAGPGAAYNNGAGVYIQTVKPQSLDWGAYGFWVGEDLQNGAFVQVGYEITNASGDYPRLCGTSGCNGSVYLQKGIPTWFWEYFPQGYNGTSFYGGIGQNDSAGANGTYNKYWFASSGNTWNFYFNNDTIGSVNLGTSGSGWHTPVAYAELANARDNSNLLNTVLFKNFSYYINGVLNLVQQGLAFRGYGAGSATQLHNPFGVGEINGYADYFAVGSDQPFTTNGTSLWSGSYRLNVASPYGNTTGSGQYATFSLASFGVQPYVYLTPTKREAFIGWVGKGLGSYTGIANPTVVRVSNNITETAGWILQDYVNVSSEFSSASGSGWYTENSMASISLQSSVVNTSTGTREVFEGWNSGQSGPKTSVIVHAPTQITASWQKEYFVGLTTPYGTANGTGWYPDGSTAYISLSNDYFNVTPSTRIAFYSWSDLYNKSSVNLTVSSPVLLNAIFKRQHLVQFVAKDANLNTVTPQYFIVNGQQVPSSSMLFDNVPYKVTGIYYKGVVVPTNRSVNVSSNVQVPMAFPIYNLVITAHSLLGRPLNATIYLAFKNGTTLSEHLGPSGTVFFQDVPFGYVNGYAVDGIMRESLSAQNGSNVSLVMITPLVALPLTLVIIVMLLYEILHRRVFEKSYGKGNKGTLRKR